MAQCLEFSSNRYDTSVSEDHVTDNEFEGCIRMSSNIMKELVAGLLHCLIALCLSGYNGADGCS